MNIFFKRSIQLLIVIIFISTCAIPASAQRKKILKNLPSALKKGKTSVTNTTTTIPRASRVQPTLEGVTVPPGTLSVPNDLSTAQKEYSGLFLEATPQTPLALSNAQVGMNIQRETFVLLENATPDQLANAAYTWARLHPGKTLKSNPVLDSVAKKFLSVKKPSLAIAVMSPFLKMLRDDKTIKKSFTQLAEAYPSYPNNVSLNQWGFPDKIMVKVLLEPYLLAADPVEMGAFILHPSLAETGELRKTGLALSEEERVAAETLLERRLTRAAIPLESSPREVLQVAYNYFVTQAQLTKGNIYEINFAYRYRSDVAFEKLTAAEKEAFIVHKLIRYQLKQSHINELRNNIKDFHSGLALNIDLAHLQLLDYVASKNANGILHSVDAGYYNTLEGLQKALQAYNTLEQVPDVTFNILQRDIGRRAYTLLGEDFTKAYTSPARLTEREKHELVELLPKPLRKRYGY